MFFDKFPVIETRRLLLREITVEDVNEIFSVYSDPVAMKYFGKHPYADISQAYGMIERVTNAFQTREGIRWGITLKPSDKLIGSGGFWRLIKEHFRAEIGYELSPSFWNKGIMTEALEEIVKFGFEKMNLHTIEANLDPENIASIKLLEKSGFVKEGHTKESYYFNGKFTDTLIYSLLKRKVIADS